MKFKEKISRFEYLINIIPPLLLQIKEDEFFFISAINKWSKKQILGHLIDSATINHHRLVRAQFEDQPILAYDQNMWNTFNFYQKIPSTQLINFWSAYNLQILELRKNMDENSLKRLCNTGNSFVTLESLFNDYVDHLEHHLNQIVIY